MVGRIDGWVVVDGFVGVVDGKVWGGWSSIGIWRGVGRGVRIMLVMPVCRYIHLKEGKKHLWVFCVVLGFEIVF